jgi:DNA-binding NarL/FixJ family response regulator
VINNINQKTTIVLVEDHLIVRDGLRALLEFENDFKILGEAGDGQMAIKMVQLIKPDVVVMDIALPKLNGIEATRQILKSNSKIKILILSAYDDDGYIEKLMTLGVSGYITKQCAAHVLVDAIRSIKNGHKFFSQNIQEKLKHIQKEHFTRDGVCTLKIQSLSTREAEVLQLIAEGKATKEVAVELKISAKTVEKHRQNLMKKLSIHDVSGLTRYAISEGIIECGFIRKKI